MRKFIALFDAHWGYERRGGHKVALHDTKAIAAALKFAADFRPDVCVLGGDILDCGCISHHNHGKPGAVEGFRLMEDAKELRGEVLDPLEDATKGRLIYHIGNHEDWLTDLSDQIPALEGIVGVKPLLKLGKRWDVVEQGDSSRLGKLVFIHGDQIKGGENAAKNAVAAYERNVRMGHYHTYQAHTKTSAVDMNGHTAVVVPCLCKKRPRYGQGGPNKWMQGFQWGYVEGPRDSFADYTSIIVNGSFIANGKEFKG